MKEIGILNRDIAAIISVMGHADEMVVCDAGFAIPLGVKSVDVSLAENKPTVIEALEEILRYFSVEKLVLANETREISPSMFERIVAMFDEKVTIETIPHTEFRQRSKDVKAIVRTGDFTAYTNVLLVSGAGDRWYVEKPPERNPK
jgi:D-ribose pyranase